MSSGIFLVDTSVWIEYFRRRKTKKNLRIIKILKSLETTAKVTTCGIVLAEFIQGLGADRKELAARQILEAHEYLASFKKAYLLAGELSRSLSRKGFNTPLSDCLIAATAMVYGATLVAEDAHFKRFTGLKLKFVS